MENLPVDVITKVSNYLVGEHKNLRLKHNKALKKTQNKFKHKINTLDT